MRFHAILPSLMALWVSSILLGTEAKAQPTSSSLTFPREDNLQAWMRKYKVPAVGIGLIENGKVKQVRVWGTHQKNHSAPVNTIFNVASIAKPVMAMLTLKLIEAGQWKLDEPLAKYWSDPDVKAHPWHKKLTTRHVLTHQTGFTNWRQNHPTQKLTFDFEPGTQYQYSGEGFEYLRFALERKFRVAYERLLDSVLLIPLGMRQTGFWKETLDFTRFAAWYDAQGNRYEISYQTGISAADDLLTTVEDLCKLGAAVVNGAGLSAQLYQQMITPWAKVDKHYSWGLGWGLVTGLANGEYALEQGGSDMGVKAQVIFLPKSKRGIVVLTNGDNGRNLYKNVIKESLDIGKAILESMHPTPPLPTAIAVSDQILQSYVGTYLQPTGRPLEITKEGNTLTISGSGWPLIELYPAAKDRFFDAEFDLQLVFIHDKASKQAKAIVYEKGKQLMELIKK